tara:strand:+ start:9090 stop:9800 length:711 start_codon:yes stop_codon:yes gene_type:complete
MIDPRRRDLCAGLATVATIHLQIFTSKLANLHIYERRKRDTPGELMSKCTIINGVDYGPLAALVGTWSGAKGLDRAPEPDGDEDNPYYETITFEAAGDVTNAEEETLAIVHYKQIVKRQSNDEVFHHQVGYWLWDAANNNITETFTIPRAVAVVAQGSLAAPDNLEQELVFNVSTSAESADIAQSTFMFNRAKTTGFSHRITVKGNLMSYQETTVLDIYGRSNYDHTDANSLEREA